MAHLPQGGARCASARRASLVRRDSHPGMIPDLWTKSCQFPANTATAPAFKLDWNAVSAEAGATAWPWRESCSRTDSAVSRGSNRNVGVAQELQSLPRSSYRLPPLPPRWRSCRDRALANVCCTNFSLSMLRDETRSSWYRLTCFATARRSPRCLRETSLVMCMDVTPARLFVSDDGLLRSTTTKPCLLAAIGCPRHTDPLPLIV